MTNSDHMMDLQHILALVTELPDRPGWSLESHAAGDVVTISPSEKNPTEWISCRERDMVADPDFEVRG